MARQATPRSSKSKREAPRAPARPLFSRLQFSWGGREWQIAGVLVVLLATFALLALARLTPGSLSDSLADRLTWLFGWGAFAVPVAVGVIGYMIFRRGHDHSIELDWLTIVGWEVIFCSVLAMMHSWAMWAEPWPLLNQHGGGGVVGWGLSTLISSNVGTGTIGRVTAGFVFLVLTLIGIWVAFRVPVAQWAVRWSGLQVPDMTRAKQLPLPEPAPVEKPREPKPKRQKLPPVDVKIVTAQEKKAKAPRRDKKLPPLDLLDKILILRLAVHDGLDLVLAVKFHQDVPLSNAGAVLDQFGDQHDHGALSRQPGCEHGVGSHRFHRALKPDPAVEILAFDTHGIGACIGARRRARCHPVAA